MPSELIECKISQLREPTHCGGSGRSLESIVLASLERTVFNFLQFQQKFLRDADSLRHLHSAQRLADAR